MPPGEVMITTDGFTVQPLEFPGGDIGSLAVHGTVNDPAVAGATPVYLSLNAFIEEGLEFAQLDSSDCEHGTRRRNVWRTHCRR
jgi:hydrogenase expression/formation protein HypE